MHFCNASLGISIQFAVVCGALAILIFANLSYTTWCNTSAIYGSLALVMQSQLLVLTLCIAMWQCR
jgi:hypothetical protein